MRSVSKITRELKGFKIAYRGLYPGGYCNYYGDMERTNSTVNNAVNFAKSNLLSYNLWLNNNFFLNFLNDLQCHYKFLNGIVEVLNIFYFNMMEARS